MVLVEEIPVSEWLVDESEEEVDYTVEKIVDMRVLNPESSKKNVKKNEPGICKHFHPGGAGRTGRGEAGELEFRIRWKGWAPEFDEWKTEKQLDCPSLLAKWVTEGLAKGNIPRPGDVDLVCGGPPCQGVSGFNRFRNDDNPLNDPKNMQVKHCPSLPFRCPFAAHPLPFHCPSAAYPPPFHRPFYSTQMPLFMRVIEVLQPTYSLLENVADIWKFPSTWPGIYGRFCVSRHMAIGYQSRVGFLVAGRYGVPQYRLRCFIWGAKAGHALPGFPMPTHRVVHKATVMPTELRGCRVVAPPERRLWREVRMGDILIDFPEIANDETRSEGVPYQGVNPKWAKELKADEKRRRDEYYSDPQKVLAYYREGAGKQLTNHVPLKMNPDDKFRAEHIPLVKGATWIDLGGATKRTMLHRLSLCLRRLKWALRPAELSADKKQTIRPFKWFADKDNNEFGEKLPPGEGRSTDKCIVPQYAVNSKVAGKGFKAALGRAWWDEIYPTCICRMQIHSHKNQHPAQPRSFSAREYARMQGLPDNHFLCGEPAKQFEQVGNAVCARLAINLGKALCLAVLDGAPDAPVVEVEPEPDADDPDAVAAGAKDVTDGDADAVGDEVDELEPEESELGASKGRKRAGSAGGKKAGGKAAKKAKPAAKPAAKGAAKPKPAGKRKPSGAPKAAAAPKAAKKKR